MKLISSCTRQRETVDAEIIPLQPLDTANSDDSPEQTTSETNEIQPPIMITDHQVTNVPSQCSLPGSQTFPKEAESGQYSFQTEHGSEDSENRMDGNWDSARYQGFIEK
jgi:hypothetical protein